MSDNGERTCPLCTEEMDLTDQQLKPCKCGYEICVWCWHHIMDMAEKGDTEGRCPACRTPYDKEKIVGMAANCERLVAEISSERKLKSLKAKPKTSEGRKHLSSVRVIQRNLVYIVGLPPTLTDEDILQHREYFGQYGKVLKVSISRTAGGAIQFSSSNTCSVYITYSKEEEAVRCIQFVHGFVLEGRPLRACFGTTKYCHAWVRNMPCNNPDCLYLHDVGTQEDSFTKDEIISAYTRSRAQQITGAINNLQRRSGNILPPPADEYCNTGTISGKPIVKSVSNSPANQVRGSPPNGSSTRSIALPAAASWVMRVSNGRPPAASSDCLNGSLKEKPDVFNGSLVLPSVVASTTQTSMLHGDVGKRSMVTEESNATDSNSRLGSLQSSEQYIVRDSRYSVLDVSAEQVLEAPAAVISSNHLPSASKDNNKDSTTPPKITNSGLGRLSCSSGQHKYGDVVAAGSIQSLCSGLASLDIEHSDIMHNGLVPNHLSLNPAGNQGLQQHYVKQSRESSTSLALQQSVTSSNTVCVSIESSDWKPESQIQVPQDAVEEGLQVFDGQGFNFSGVGRTSYLSHSSNSLKISNGSTGHSSEHGDTWSTSNPGNADPRTVRTKVDGSSLPFTSGSSNLCNGYNDNEVVGFGDLDKNFKCSNLFSNIDQGKFAGRSNNGVANVDKYTSLDIGENMIISNILSMDSDAWDDSLTSPHNLAKLLSETDKQHGSLKISSSRKIQNSNQSRFSFARQESFANHGTDIESSFSRYSEESRDPYLGMLQNGFSSSSSEESDTYPSGDLIPSSDKLSISRAPISAPPGFSFPSRAPPPGFSSQESMDQAFDTTTGNHLLENSSLLRSQYPALPTGNISSTGDVEFIDPAILAVGKGRLPNGINNLGLDMRSTFPLQFRASDNDSRIQQLMQQSISTHQNLRFSDHIGDNFSHLNDAYNIPSRLIEQSLASNLSPFAPFSFPQSRNVHMSNGHWDSRNEVQTRNDLAMAELLRNEKFGLNKFSPAYDDLKFRIPNPGDLYQRAFGM